MTAPSSELPPGYLPTELLDELQSLYAHASRLTREGVSRRRIRQLLGQHDLDVVAAVLRAHGWQVPR